MCVDPDWYPYERVSPDGKYEGIGADLIDLIARRLGMNLVLVPTSDWTQSVEYSKSGRCDILPFLNETPQRDEWLLFTDSYFTDKNVLITREDHDYISELAGRRDESIVLPEGTSIEERLRRDYPRLTVLTAGSENEVFRMVSERKADMTLRSLTVAAYTIKKDGWFNLKIAGEIPEYANYLRIGVVSDKPLLRDIFNKGVRTITPEDVQAVVNKHISITVADRVDYALILKIVLIFSALLALGLAWVMQLRKLNRKLLELTKKLQQMAEYDNLTELPNRALFADRLKQSVLQYRRYGETPAVLFIDLDGFKRVNDTLGHEAGDKVLIEASRRIRSSIRESDTAARLGGDEFAALLNHVDSRESVERLAGKLCARIAEPFSLDGIAVDISASVGIALCPEHGETDSELLKNADAAMYRSKARGKNRVTVFIQESE